MLIAIDPGHGIHTRGKRFPRENVNGRDIPEWEPNQQVGTRLCRLLEQYQGVKTVRMDDPTGANDVPLHDRPRKANRLHADLYVSLHHNAGPKGNTSACGIVVFVYNETKRKESTDFQRIAYDKLIQHTGMRGNRASPLGRANLCVLRESNMPAVLCEMGFMTNPTEARQILTPEHYDQCAAALCEAVVEMYHLKPKQPVLPPKKEEENIMQFTPEMEDKIEQLVRKVLTENNNKESTLPKQWAEAQRLGITSGGSPCGFCTREQAATMAVNAVQAAVKKIEEKHFMEDDIPVCPPASKPAAMISQPMRGKTDDEILSERNKAMAFLAGEGFTVLNTFFNDDGHSAENLSRFGIKNQPLYCLADSLMAMSRCDAVYFCEGWEVARGCKIEHEAACMYGLQVIYAEDAASPNDMVAVEG